MHQDKLLLNLFFVAAWWSLFLFSCRVSQSCMVVEVKDELVGCHRGPDPVSKLPTVDTKKRRSASLVFFVCHFPFFLNFLFTSAKILVDLP